MPDIAAQTLALPGLVWVVAITLVAGIVYGFAGFGAALVFMPVASVFVPVEVAVAAFSVSALASLVTVVPRAWAQADRPATLWMIGCATLTAPLGIWVLRTTDVATLRWGLLIVVAVTLLALMTGWRYSTRPGRMTRAGVGLGTGFLGGATGLLGPIVILFQLSGGDTVARSRANTLVFLTVTSLLLLPFMALQGILSPEAVALGLVLLVPYGLGARIGQGLFDPARETLYRNCAYCIIAAAIVLGLPLWD
ncbi:sulfite exporter TauE/SafE family protein [Sulfitobacter sabulilitoris]|uniref:Probable membrane transporter protein n=1 Tax=Sulfitobacter sabulilitoris TaxID=2562655 RepID=A0A5S3PIQ7_9RHOB|nr:sulfite exporter TauE/SafE family protein [Sulfitobacter sabulilitoris]TMM54263.1 sulfite exporter TauE/SafE family protein [Sulfitobacter sabulilitoris]